MVNAYDGFTTTVGGRLNINNAKVVFGDPFSGSVYEGGLVLWFELGNIISWIVEPKAPTIELVSVTRTA